MRKMAVPVSALVVRIVGRLKILPREACAKMLLLNANASMSRLIWYKPT